MTEEKMLRKAAEVIRRRGWCTSVYGDIKGRVCMLGAISVAQGFCANHSWLTRNEPAALYALTGAVAPFNDKQCESADDAIAALEIAADLAA